MCIALQGMSAQIGFFLHMQNHVFKRPIVFPRPQIFAIGILALLYIIVAQIKDLPDIEGDRKHGVKNLSVLIGPKPVFWICVSLLEIAYGVAIMAVGHAILASILWYRAKSVDLKNNASTFSFYMLIWELVRAEYFLVPFVR
ncbi:hypothetical protein VNO77_33873 [Canavalia gladiata]|uniref:Uncharacterized protein n=1 Tax=Canavalia gladiata TaxID=3824 RepID=A0AAN9Q174_CANGL